MVKFDLGEDDEVQAIWRIDNLINDATTYAGRSLHAAYDILFDTNEGIEDAIRGQLLRDTYD